MGRGALIQCRSGAAALKTECIIYTDVEGVYTTDPNLVKEAKISQISYEEMLELASGS